MGRHPDPRGAPTVAPARVNPRETIIREQRVAVHMGLFDRLSSSEDSGLWGVVVRDQTNGNWTGPPEGISKEDWLWEDPPDEENFLYQYENDLEPHCTYILVKEAGPQEAQRWDFDSEEWRIEADEEETEEMKEIRRLRDDMAESKGAEPEVDWTDVESTEEVQAKMMGMAASKGMEIAETPEDVANILGAIQGQQQSNPAEQLFGGMESNLEINSISEMMALMFMGQNQDAIGDILENLSGGLEGISALAGGTGGGGGAASQDGTVTLSEDEYRRLKEGGSGAQQADSEPEDDDSFSMDDYVDDTADDPEPDPEPDEHPATDGREPAPDEWDDPNSAAPETAETDGGERDE